LIHARPQRSGGPDESKVGHRLGDRFKLTGDATDSINADYNGSASAAVSFPANDRGNLTAARFNGTDASVTVPDPSGLTTNAPIDTTQSFTVSAWVKLANGPNTGGSQTVVAQNGSQERGYFLGYDDGTQTWKFDMQPTNDANFNPTSIKSAPLSGGQYGVWNHLVGVYDATAKEMYLYVNGTLARSAAYTSTVNFATQMVIGGGALYQSQTTDYLNGDISDVVLYTSALNATQVQQLYTATMATGQ